jgi:hypothetical protein
MKVSDIETRYQVKIKSGDQLIKRLSATVKRYEFRYEVPSAQMLKDVRACKVRQTREIDRWMQHYLVLGQLLGTPRKKAERSARLEHVRKLSCDLRTVRSKSSVQRSNKTPA